MQLFPKKLLMEQVPDMTLYNMVEWTLMYRNEKVPEEGIRVTIVLRRKIVSEMLTTFLPIVYHLPFMHLPLDFWYICP